MLKLCVYYNDVLRYTVYANLEKAQELQDQGFYVEVEPSKPCIRVARREQGTAPLELFEDCLTMTEHFVVQ